MSARKAKRGCSMYAEGIVNWALATVLSAVFVCIYAVQDANWNRRYRATR